MGKGSEIGSNSPEIQPKKVMFVVDSREGGIYAAIQSLSDILTRQGIQTVIVEPGKSLEDQKTEKDGTTVYDLSARRRWDALDFPRHLRLFPREEPITLRRKVREIIEEENPDIIHLQTSPTPFTLARAAEKIGRQRGITVGSTVHITRESVEAGLKYVPILRLFPPVVKTLTKVYMRLARWGYNHMDFLTVPTESGREEARRFGIKKEMDVISNGVSSEFNPENRNSQRAEKLRESLSIPDNIPLFLYVGRLSREKRLDQLILALEKVAKRTTNPFKVIIFGEGPESEKLKRLIKQKGLEDYFIFQSREEALKRNPDLDPKTFQGAFTDEEEPYLYAIGANKNPVFFVSPSDAELQGIAPLKAKASGLPVILADAGATKELVKDEDGFLFNPYSNPPVIGNLIHRLAEKVKPLRSLRSPDDLAEKLLQALQLPQENIVKMGDLARQHAIEHDLESVGQRMIDEVYIPALRRGRNLTIVSR